MKQLLLKEFFEKDKFSCLNFGMLDTEIKECIGEPDLKGGTTRKNPIPTIWKYGDMELGFDPKKRVLMNIVFNFWEYSNSGLNGGSKITIDSMGLRKGMPFNEFQLLLKKEGLIFRQIDPLEPGTRRVLVGKMIEVIFNEDENLFGNWIGLVKIIGTIGK